MSLFEWLLSCSRATQTPWQISLRSCRRRDTRRRVTMDAPGEIRPPFFVCIINRVEKDTKTLLVILLPTRDVILHPIEKRESKERKKKSASKRFRRRRVIRRRTPSECSPSKHNLPGTNTSCFSPPADDDDFDDDEDKATTSSKDVVSSRIILFCGGGK